MNKLVALFFTFITVTGTSQDRLDIIDILNYRINLNVSEEHDTIVVNEQIFAKLHVKVDSFYLDLHSLNEGKGMNISKAEVVIDGNNEVVSYSHNENKLWISSTTIPIETEFKIEIRFSGVPETGLIIGENKFGQRTYFGDNWPNRAHHWFACVDHPSDKAKVSFSVTYPKNYDVIATGRIINNGYTADKNIVYYVSDIELPTKVMVVGIAEFEKEFIYHDNFNLFPMSAWVYEADSANGFKDMAVAADVVNYFVKAIGPYPFEKLDHVQSTTQFGGMENAGNIFYDENAVTGNETMEALIAHEVAHQWFGNSASEADWPHLWLSEGFATYFTDLYWEDKYGTEAMNERLINERKRVIQFSKRYDHPVIDTTYQSLMHLLNANSYQKGAWFLHMLRNEVGDSTFWSGIRTYYSTYKYSNATTADFQTIMETESGMDLSVFFNQWLRQSLHPILKIKSKTKGNELILKILQKQKTHLYKFDLEVELIYEDGTAEIRSIPISEKKEVVILSNDKVISAINYDPNIRLLYELVGE